VDMEKSLEELINVGKRTHEQTLKNKHFVRQNNDRKLPHSFYNRNTCKSRASSAHSREGSSDDGFGSSGRQTLSPASISSSNIVGNNFPAYGGHGPTGVIHERQYSAPAHINYEGVVEPPLPHPSRYGQSTRTALPGTSGLPPVAQGYPLGTKSMSTVAIPGAVVGASCAQFSGESVANDHSSSIGPHIAHRSVKSCDFESMMHNNASIKAEPSMNFPFSGMSPTTPNLGSSAEATGFYTEHKHSPTPLWNDPRKSQSLDPMTLNVMDNQQASVSIPHNTAQPSSIHQPMAFNSLPVPQSIPNNVTMDDALGPLPDGWAKAYDHNNDPYFIDHINKTTTWFDPRISKEVQQAQINMRHSDRAKNTMNYQLPTPTAFGNAGQSLQHSSFPCGNLDRVQQLQRERSDMIQRRQQLCRQGFLGNDQSPQAHYITSGNVMSPQHEAIFPPQQYSHFAQQMSVPPSMGAPTSDGDGGMNSYMGDNEMEVDYNHVPPPMHQINPALVHELTASDINPNEFDRYLRINDSQQAMAKYM
jgi:hypothetical protein